MVVFISDTVKTSQSLIEDISQEALVSAFDEETQAAQEQKKEEMDSPAEKALTVVKESGIKKSTKETEKVTFKDVVQTSVASKDPEVKLDTEAKKVPEYVAPERISAKIDTTQSAKVTAKESDVGAAEKRQVTTEEKPSSGKGIKRSLEEDTEKPASSSSSVVLTVEKEPSSGKGIKRPLEEEKPAEAKTMQEGGGKRPRKDEPAIDSSPQPKKQDQKQVTLKEEEAEAMETETDITKAQKQENITKKEQRMEVDEVDKDEDGSRDGEGDEVGEDDVEKKSKEKDGSKEDEDKDDGKEDEDKEEDDKDKDDGKEDDDRDKDDEDKDKDDSKEDDESALSKKRKKKKRSYDRPRGEGGKFMKEKPGTYGIMQ